MATAKFWNIPELKVLVFSHLHDNECQKDLFSCALVHSTWTEPAIDALWQGYPGFGYRWGGYRNNGDITEALLALPRSCRQRYASRVSVLDFFQVEVDAPLLQTMFEDMEFSRLRELLLNLYDDETLHKSDLLQISSHLPSKLKALRITGPSYTRKSLTATFLKELAEQCPSLKELWLAVPRASVSSSNLAVFFRTIRPREVCLDFVRCKDVLITHDVLAALSDGGCLEVLSVGCKDESRADVAAAQLQHFCEKTANPFPSLKELSMEFHTDAIPWVSRCFPTVTKLRIKVYTSDRSRVTSVLKHLAEMTQLRELEIMRNQDRSNFDMTIPPKEFLALGSLPQLVTLKIGSVFYLDAGESFTEEHARVMFSGLTALEELCIALPGNHSTYSYPRYILRVISRSCCKLKSLRLVGVFHLGHFGDPSNPPRFDNLEELRFDAVETWDTPLKAAKVIDAFAPKLKRLSPDSCTKVISEICDCFMNLHCLSGDALG